MKSSQPQLKFRTTGRIHLENPTGKLDPLALADWMVEVTAPTFETAVFKFLATSKVKYPDPGVFWVYVASWEPDNLYDNGMPRRCRAMRCEFHPE